MEHDYDSVPTVRGRPEVTMGQNITVVKIKVRVDHYPGSGEVDWSLIAWEHPGGHLVRNQLWSTYDACHVGMAAPDIVAGIYSTLRLYPEPF